MVELLLRAGANPDVQEKVRTTTAAVHKTLVYHGQFSVVYLARPSLTLRKVRGGLADLSIHELLTNRILLFNFETVATR